MKSAAREGKLTTDIVAGALVAFLCANFSLSYAALLFAGTAPATQAQGLVMMLTGSVTGAVIGGRLVSLPFSIFFADGTLMALLATVTASIVVDMRGAPTASVAATMTTTILLAGLATGAALWLIGRLRAGRIVRFVPFQVMAGVLAGGGWALSTGGAALAMGRPVTLDALVDVAAAPKLLAALVLAVAMLTLTARFRHPFTLALVIVGAVGLHHATFFALGRTLAEQRADGWLLGLPPRLHPVIPWSPATMGEVDWRVIGRHAGHLLVMLPVAAICLLLGITGIETATGRDADVDRDLMANGVSTFACGLVGGMFCVTSVSRTLLVYEMGARSRRAGLMAGIGGGLLPLLWPAGLGAVPRYVLGALLLFAGLSMLQQWVVRTRRRLARLEWFTVLAVLATSARFGMIAGTFTGLLLGCAAFVVIYSRGSPIRARYRGDAAHAQVDRSSTELAFLAEQAGSLLVMHLQGFMFFGTGSRLVDEVRREVAAAPGLLKHILLDFSNVDGIDGSAFASFERLQRVAIVEGIALAFAAMPPAVAARLAGLPRLPGAEIHIASTLDDAMEWRERAVLAALSCGTPPHVRTLLRSEFTRPEDADVFLRCLEEVEVHPGEVMMHQGEASDELFFIERGRASVTVCFRDRAPLRVRAVGAGVMVGEIGFCLGLPRTATVTAEAPCHVLRLTRAAMARLEVESPAAALAFQRAVMRRLGARLLDKDKLIASLVADRPQLGAAE